MKLEVFTLPSEPKKVPFKLVRIGECFRETPPDDDVLIYMKVSTGEKNNAISMRACLFECFAPDDKVTLVDAKLRITERN